MKTQPFAICSYYLRDLPPDHGILCSQPFAPDYCAEHAYVGAPAAPELQDDALPELAFADAAPPPYAADDAPLICECTTASGEYTYTGMCGMHDLFGLIHHGQ